MEKILEEVSFSAPDKSGSTVIIDDKYVDEHLNELTSSINVLLSEKDEFSKIKEILL